MSTSLIPERLALVKDIPLTVGSHTRPADGTAPCGLCAMEKYAFITGQPWTDSPDNCCPTIGAYSRRLNDRGSQATRDAYDVWMVANVDRIARTAHDGHRKARGFILMDHAIRTALAVRLDAAKRPDDAARLRALPEIVDRATSDAVVRVVREIRATLPDGWQWRQKVRAKYREAILAELKKRPVAAAVADAAAAADAAAVAAADAAADAVAAAAAAADADADAAAAAAADAVAAAAAVAVADADAAAAAAADADAAAAAVAVAVADADPWGARYWNVYNAVYPILRARFVAIYGEPTDPTIVLERLVACGEAA